MDRVTIRHHAVLFALLARAATQKQGGAAEESVREATRHYGRQRGGRMRHRAENLGIPLDMAGYFALKEWRAPEGAQAAKPEQLSPAFIDAVTLCPWVSAWREYKLLEFGRLYCLDVDRALLEGFNPALRLEVDAMLSAGDACCRFRYLDADMERDGPRVEAYRAQAGEAAVKPFSYHTAHLYAAFRDTFREGDILAKARRDFISLFGREVWEEAQEYARADFDLP